jgi:ParB-like nuclease domain
MSSKSEMKSYLKHSTNRDIGNLFSSGDYRNLHEVQQKEAISELKDRAKNFYGVDTSKYPSFSDLGKEVVKELDKREKAMPETYKKSPYYKAGKVSLVPVHWLQKFQGNSLRRDSKEMREFADELMQDGLEDPVMIIIGQEDRRVSIGEGNHRTFAHIQAGLDYVPARVARQVKNIRGAYYDKMSRVPEDDYFPADSSPENVFDTFYDHGDMPKEPEPEPEEDFDDDDFDDDILSELDDLDFEGPTNTKEKKDALTALMDELGF